MKDTTIAADHCHAEGIDEQLTLTTVAELPADIPIVGSLLVGRD